MQTGKECSKSRREKVEKKVEVYRANRSQRSAPKSSDRNRELGAGKVARRNRAARKGERAPEESGGPVGG